MESQTKDKSDPQSAGVVPDGTATVLQEAATVQLRKVSKWHDAANASLLKAIAEALECIPTPKNGIPAAVWLTVAKVMAPIAASACAQQFQKVRRLTSFNAL
jgi:hypothetical protein